MEKLSIACAPCLEPCSDLERPRSNHLECKAVAYGLFRELGRRITTENARWNQGMRTSSIIRLTWPRPEQVTNRS